MIRRRFLSLVAVAPLASCAANAAAPPAPARDYRRGLPDHLRSLAARAADARRRALDDLTTVESVHLRQTWARSALWRLAGGAPDRTPLSVRTTGEIRHPDYRVEKLVYESRPGLHVPALLYLPIGRSGPVPGVLFQAGHLPEGKAAPAYQRACQALVKLGLGVLSFDPIGQGERRTRASAALPDDEHDRIGQPLLLSGDTMTGLMLWDAVRSLDVLASRPEIDPHRLGAFGHSGGGTMTMFLSAVDDRLAAAALSCANTENVAVADFDPPGAIDDAEQNLPGAALLGFDRWDTLYPLAPKPLLVLVSTKDPFSIYSPNYLVNGREELERLKHVYDLLSRAEHLRWVESSAPHGISPDRRAEVEHWLGRHLLGENPPSPAEADLVPEPIEATWVVPGGDIVQALAGRTPLDLARERANATSAHPITDLFAQLGVERPKPGLRMDVLASKPMTGCELDIIEVRSAPEVWIPAPLYRPPSVQSILIAIEPEPRALPEQVWPALAREGLAICTADLRGIGAMLPERSAGASAYARSHPVEDGFASASLILGESLLSQRITDLLALVESLSNHPALSARPLALAARGALTIPALFAAALDPRIAALHLDGPLASYRSVLETESPRCPLASIFPGILSIIDLPAAAALISPRPVILAGPVDGQGNPMSLAAARALYAGAPNVSIVPERSWGFDAVATISSRLRVH